MLINSNLLELNQNKIIYIKRIRSNPLDQRESVF